MLGSVLMNKSFSVNPPSFFKKSYLMVKLSIGLGHICVSSCNKVATLRTLVHRVL